MNRVRGRIGLVNEAGQRVKGGIFLVAAALLLVVASVFTQLAYAAPNETTSPQRIDTWGSQGSADGQFSSPSGVTIDTDGNVYVADTYNNRIQKFTPDGEFITAWGSQGSDYNQLSLPSGITADADYVYVVDSNNHRIQKFSPEGALITSWGGDGPGWNGSGSDNGQFYRPMGIATDTDGNVYVADNYNNRIQKFTSDGTFYAQWGSAGSVDGQFYNPSDITIDANNNVYVTDTYNNRIQKFTSDGIFLANWSVDINAGDGDIPLFGIVVGSGGKVYFAAHYLSELQVFGYPYYNANLLNAETGAAVTLETPEGTALTCNSTVKESELTAQDANYSYPVGLVDFCFTTPEEDNQVTLTFVTDRKASDMVLRKYNPGTGKYATVSGATLTNTTYNGRDAIQAMYTITDNGPLDIDPDVGEIADPVGLAEAANDGDETIGGTDTLPGAPDTGVATITSPLRGALGIVTLGLVTLVVIISRHLIAKKSGCS